MQMRGDLGALLRADPLRALARQRADEPHDPGREDHAEHDDRDEHREQHVARRAERAGRLEEDEAGGDHERDADAGARDGERGAPALLVPELVERRGDAACGGPPRPSAGAGDGGGAAVATGGRGGGGLTGAGSGSREPSDWRQISAPPLATRTSGQASASENQIPRPRKVSSTLRSSRPVPSATSTAARPRGARRGAVAWASPAGMRSQASG